MEIKGRCKKIENRDKQNGFATFLFECFDDNKTIRAIGPMAEPKEMQMYVLDGDMDANGFFRFGYSRPFSDCKAESIEIISKAGIGINEKTAKAIVDRFGDDVYAYGSILGFKEKLMEFPGIGEKKAQAAVELVRREIRGKQCIPDAFHGRDPIHGDIGIPERIRSSCGGGNHKKPIRSHEIRCGVLRV